MATQQMVAFRLPKDVIDRIDALVEAQAKHPDVWEGPTKSEVVRQALRFGLRRLERQTEKIAHEYDLVERRQAYREASRKGHGDEPEPPVAPETDETLDDELF